MGVVTWHCSGVVETENPWKLASDARWPRRCTPVPGVARWWTPIRGGVRVLLAENTRNTSGHRTALLWKKENHNCESLAVMSAIILIKNKAPLPFMHQVSSVSRSGFSLIGVFCILLRRLMQLVCRVSCWRRAMIRGSPTIRPFEPMMFPWKKSWISSYLQVNNGGFREIVNVENWAIGDTPSLLWFLIELSTLPLFSLSLFTSVSLRMSPCPEYFVTYYDRYSIKTNI